MLHQLPPELRELDEDNRKKFANVAAIFLIELLGDDGVLQVIQDGEARLRSFFFHFYRPQAFGVDDFERVWIVLNYHAHQVLQKRHLGAVRFDG